MDINANINSAKCIVEQSNIGSTTYVNICNGTHQAVAWGSADWFALCFGLSIIVAFVWLVVVAVRY